MPKFVKDDYVKGLDEFFAPIGLKVDWAKMTVKDLEALSEVLQDNDKVSKLFGLGQVMDHQVAAVPDSVGLGGLLDGGLLEGGGELRDKVGNVLDAGIDGAVAALKKEKPLRSQIGSGKLISRLLQMGGGNQ